MGATASRAVRLPERLTGAPRTLMLLADASIVFFVSALLESGSNSRMAAALVTAAIVVLVFWHCGFYRRSYAVYPRDECYYVAVGIALAAIPVIALLATVGQVPIALTALALGISGLGIAVAHMRLHLERRAAAAPVYAGIQTITPQGWAEREAAAYRSTKRIVDIFLALLALIVTSPIMLIAAAAIRLESKGPTFFRQDRIGANGRRFQICKFRTMRPDAGREWAKPGDTRITRVGAFLRRTSLDELPQAFNVLRGDMSIVGPRPEMESFARDFSATIPNYDQRHVVAPGITGWAQVYLKRNLEPSDMPQVLPYDLFYVEYASPIIDAAIVLKTAAEVLFHRAV